MISVHADLRLKEKKIILSPNVCFSKKEEDTLRTLGWRQNVHGQFLSGYDTYLKCKDQLEAKESAALTKYLEELQAASKAQLASVEAYMDTDCPFKLFEYQKDFVRWFNDPLKTRTSVLNACEPGLGKTAMSLAAILSTNKETPLYIICPKNAVGVWIEHLKLFNYKLPITIGKFAPEKNGNCCILTYESLNPTQKEANEKKRFMENFLKDIPKNPVLIADEFHKCKNRETKMTKRFKALFKLVQKRQGKCIALTGTPIMSYSQDLKTILNNLDLLKPSFGNTSEFDKLYGGEFDWKTKRMIWDESKRQPEIIKAKVYDVMFLRKKKDVIDQLPEYIDSFIDIDLAIDKENSNVLNSLFTKYAGMEDLLIVSDSDIKLYQKIRSSLALAKYELALDTIKEYEEANIPIIVFSCFVPPIEALGKRKGWKCIHGKTSPEDRTHYKNLINEGKLKGLAVTIGAGSTALSIPGVDTSLFLDLSTRPGDNKQARMRTDRVNHIKEKLNYVYFRSNHPFEVKMITMLLAKEKLVLDSY